MYNKPDKYVSCTSREHLVNPSIPVLIGLCAIYVIELLFVFIEAVFVAPRSEELGIAT